MAGVTGTFNNPDPENMTLEQLKTMFAKELEEWENAGISPQGIQFNIFQLDAMVMTLIKHLVAHEIINQDALDKDYVAHTIEQLRMHRKNIMELRRRQVEGPLIARKPILGADGVPIDPRAL